MPMQPKNVLTKAMRTTSMQNKFQEKKNLARDSSNSNNFKANFILTSKYL